MPIRQRIADATRSINLFWPLVMLALMAGAALVGGILIAVRQFDAVSLDREQTIVRNGIHQRVDELAMLVVPQVVWDDAVAHLDNRLDNDWADKNVASFLSDINDFRSAFLLDGGDRAVYASTSGKRIAPDSFAPYRGATRPLIGHVRSAERARPPLIPAPDQASMITSPISSSGIAVIGGVPQILIATLVQPDFGTALPRGPRAPIVITTMPMDKVFLDKIAQRYLLNDLRIQANPSLSAHEADHRAHVVLHDHNRRPVAILEWQPRSPGTALLNRLIVPLLAVLGAITFVALLLIRRSSRVANELIASEARASHLAYHDSLTGLPNRVLMFDRMRQMLNQMRRGRGQIAIHCIDLDRFKEVNDTLGHHAGDELIRAAGKRLTSLIRSADTVARLGGDEFVILQSGADANAARQLAERIISILTEPFDLSDGQVSVGCSIGITLVDNPDFDTNEILRQADMALYRAKAQGRGQAAFFEFEMDSALKMRRGLEEDLRRALAAEELGLLYQPQVDSNGRICGVEALVRWNHAERGMISPATFVPLAEECGLIPDLGQFVLRRAFTDARDWRELRVAVNVSPIQLRQPRFGGQVEEMVREFGIEPSQFEIEITESALLGDDINTRRTLRHFRRLGFSIALDDFGTGYSSLSYLQKYPVSKIKIDRSFIANLGADAESEAVVEAIVKLARALNLDVIAEGVETAEQRHRLLRIGCTDIQGFLFSQPIPAEAVGRLLATQRKADAAASRPVLRAGQRR